MFVGQVMQRLRPCDWECVSHRKFITQLAAVRHLWLLNRLQLQEKEQEGVQSHARWAALQHVHAASLSPDTLQEEQAALHDLSAS